MGREKNLMVCLLFVTGVTSLDYVESELSQLPKQFHLDDYERCLEKTDGVYCMGQFQLYSDVPDLPIHNLIQKYAQDPYLYNRSYIYRGYCLTTRCPGVDTNLSARFEGCVDKWARDRHGLRARLQNLNYCKDHRKFITSTWDKVDTHHRVFVYVVITLIALNVIGTIYDMNFENKSKFGKYLKMWSIRENWNAFTSVPHPDSDLRLDSFNGVKGIMTLTPMYCHASIILTAAYQRNPRIVEKYLYSPAGPMMGGMTTFTQIHLAMAVFLVSYYLLMSNTSLKSLPQLFLRRVCRMLPIYLLAVGFAATWWTSMGDGPMWHKVEEESKTCRKKFWVMASFLQNVIDPRQICLVQTWILAVDMQVHIPVLFVTLLLKKYRKWALYVLSAIFMATLALTAHLAFENNYIPAYTYMTPDAYRVYFYNTKSFYEFFMTSANCMLAVVVGVAMAFYHKDLQERNVKLQESKIMVFLSYVLFISIFVLTYCTYFCRDISDPWLINAMVPIERVVNAVLLGSFILLAVNVNSKLISFLRWGGFRYISRLGLSTAAVHWCINSIIVASRQTAIDASIFAVVLDTLTTFTISCIFAVPLTVMVDLPMKETLESILNLL